MKTVFLNNCSVPVWMPEEKKLFRHNADQYFQKIIESTPLFAGEEVTISYFQHGVGSIVAKVTLSGGEVYVIKTTETPNRTIAEINAYEVMSRGGIKVPQVFAKGEIGGYPFLVMEYFVQGTLSDKLKKNKISAEEIGEVKGKVFVDLQKTRGKGYGWPIEYSEEVVTGNFLDIDTFMDKWFGDIETIKVANKYEPAVDWDKELKSHSEIIKRQYQGDQTHLGSFDFQTAHFFASEPPTFFDTNPRLEPEYFDLGHHLMPNIDVNIVEFEIDKIIVKKIKNYFGEINEEKLFRATWLQTFRKATNLLLRPDGERLRRGLYMLKMLVNKDALKEHLRRYC